MRKSRSYSKKVLLKDQTKIPSVQLICSDPKREFSLISSQKEPMKSGLNKIELLSTQYKITADLRLLNLMVTHVEQICFKNYALLMLKNRELDDQMRTAAFTTTSIRSLRCSRDRTTPPISLSSWTDQLILNSKRRKSFQLK